MSATKLAKLKEFGSWSEQTSSSGKRYYYNRETEVSQWEKPTEWKDHEKTLMEKYKSSRSSSKINFSAPQQPSTATTSSSKPSAGDASASTMAAHSTTASSSTSTPLSSLRNHANSSLSALRTPAGMTTGHSSNATPSSSQTQSSSQRSRPSDSAKRSRGGDDRHHQHYSSSSSITTGTASGSGATTKPAGQSLSPFATPQSGTFDRSRDAGEKSADKFMPTLNGSSSAKSQPTFTPMPSRPAMSGGGGDASAVCSPLLSKYHNQNSSASTTTTTAPSPLAGHRQQSSTTGTLNNNNLSGSSAQKYRSNSDSVKRSSRDEHPPHAPSSKIACIDMPVVACLAGDMQTEDRNRQAAEKPSTPVLFPNALSFNEAKYVDFYRPEMAAYRRNWSSQAYIGEARRCVERSVRQAAALAAIDDDLRSVRSLMGAAELRCTLLDQKLAFIRSQIASLETKNS